mgnify:CR=1 FL=1
MWLINNVCTEIELSVDLRHKRWGLFPTCEAYVNPSQFDLSSICIVTNTSDGKNSKYKENINWMNVQTAKTKRRGEWETYGEI